MVTLPSSEVCAISPNLPRLSIPGPQAAAVLSSVALISTQPIDHDWAGPVTGR